MSDKVLRIGVTAGVNPTAAAVMKAELLGVAARTGVRIEVLSTDEELRQDATDKKTMEADRRIAALRQTTALQAMGCDEVIVPDVRIDPVRRELQAELEVPVVSIYDGLAALGPRRIGVLGYAVSADFVLSRAAEGSAVVPTSEPVMEAFRQLQNAETGLRRQGMTDEHRERFIAAARALVAAGADLLVPACTQMARFANVLKDEGLPVLDILADTAVRAVTKPLARLGKPFKVGLIGGLGPAATVDLYDKIVKATPAKTDQEHIKLVVEQNPQTPDRTACLLGQGDDPTFALYGMAMKLEADGCDAVIVPCNTAHAFMPFVERHLSIPCINMQKAALEEIQAKLGKDARIGLLATRGTVQSRIYAEKAEAMGLPMFVPDEERQDRVMAAIYGPEGAKAGFTDGVCRDDLMSGVEYLVRTYDCNCLILGCTELPLILDESDAFPVAGKSVMMIDPTAALARKVVKIALEKNKAAGR